MEEIPEGDVSETAVRAARDVRAVFSRLRRRLREAYDHDGLTPSQISLLSRLSTGGPASASDLAAAERVRPQSIAATLAVLDEFGLIDRRPDPDDGRRLLISLNDAGHGYLADKRRAGEEWLARAFQDRYTEAERTAVLEALALLDRITDR